MPNVITIQSGTRDELAGVDVGLANVYERPERPGELSILLVLPDRDLVMAVGDEITLAGRIFRLEAISPKGTGYQAHFLERLTDPVVDPTPTKAVLAIPPVTPHRLVDLLKAQSAAILDVLADGAQVPPISAWRSESRQSVHREWNGGEIGPNSHFHHVALFDDVGEAPVEARISREDIRYDPNEIYRREVSAFWRAGDATAHIFLRAEGMAELDHIVGDQLDPAIHRLICAAIDAEV